MLDIAARTQRLIQTHRATGIRFDWVAFAKPLTLTLASGVRWGWYFISRPFLLFFRLFGVLDFSASPCETIQFLGGWEWLSKKCRRSVGAIVIC